MQLTGKQIVEYNIVTGVQEDCIQQQGVDVRVKDVQKVVGMGMIPQKGKTMKSNTKPILISQDNKWRLDPGYYEVTFEEGCKLPNNYVLHYDPRSSLVRCGGRVFSGQFDGGFHTEHMGCFMELSLPITIEQGARLAQARVEETYPVDDDKLYNGQWQGDKQRQ